jgi:hypothetical protein
VRCTTLPTWPDAVRSYRQRWAAAGSYRDAQSGWDGQHGWDLEPVLTQARRVGQVARIVGLWAVGVLLQTWSGTQMAHGPAAVRAVAAQWTTTGRLSVWAQGHLALREPLLAAWVAHSLHEPLLAAWVAHILHEGAARVAASPRSFLRRCWWTRRRLAAGRKAAGHHRGRSRSRCNRRPVWHRSARCFPSPQAGSPRRRRSETTSER